MDQDEKISNPGNLSKIISQQQAKSHILQVVADTRGEKVEALESRLNQITANHAKLTEENGTLRKNFHQSNADLQQQRVLSDIQISDLRSENEQLKEAIEILRGENDAAKAEVHTLRKSMTFQVGRAFRNAWKSPTKIVLLPHALIQLHQNGKKRKNRN